MKRQIFVNLPVLDLARSMEFFKALGFSFNPQFTNEQAGCMVIEKDSIYAMLVTEPFFKGFIVAHEQADAGKVKEVITCISLESRAAVDEMMEKVVASGGREYRPADDYGWMYSRSFIDPDQHEWEIMFADASQAPAAPPATA